MRKKTVSVFTSLNVAAYHADHSLAAFLRRATEKHVLHPAEIKALLAVRTGKTLADLSRQEGLHRSAGSVALHRRWKRMEAVIAMAVGMEPAELWPDRYAGVEATKGKSE